MRFTRMGDWYELSDCGRYTVAAGKSDGVFTYCAHLVGKPTETLDCFATAAEARKCCRDHANRSPETDLAACGGVEGEG